MSDKKLYYPSNCDFKKVLEDGLEQIDPKEEGFEYIVGEIQGGKVKVVFEPDSSAYDSIEIDGVNGFGYSLVCEYTDKAAN
jgi:hypothetical protein